MSAANVYHCMSKLARQFSSSPEERLQEFGSQGSHLVSRAPLVVWLRAVGIRGEGTEEIHRVETPVVATDTLQDQRMTQRCQDDPGMEDPTDLYFQGRP